MKSLFIIAVLTVGVGTAFCWENKTMGLLTMKIESNGSALQSELRASFASGEENAPLESPALLNSENFEPLTVEEPENSINEALGVKNQEEMFEELEDTVDVLNHSAATLNYDIKFNVVPSEGVIQVEVNDSQTGDLIRAIPPDEILEVRERVKAFLGLMIDETV